MLDSSLYDKDFCDWTMKNAELMRQGKLSEVDFDHIAEELESMGKSEKRAFINRLAVLFAHLLKWQFQPGIRSKSWKYSIKEQRASLLDLLDDSPSLSHDSDAKIKKAYGKALILAARETGFDESSFPDVCPYSFDQAIDDGFLPE